MAPAAAVGVWAKRCPKISKKAMLQRDVGKMVNTNRLVQKKNTPPDRCN